MRELEETHKAIIYDIVISKVWAKTGMMKSYAATYKILNELKNCGMVPRTMLDFGCGAGPSLWAANELFKDSLEEYTGVDKSLDQLRMARYVVTGGHPDRDTPGIRFKKSLPDGIAGSKEQYNIGTSLFHEIIKAFLSFYQSCVHRRLGIFLIENQECLLSIRCGIRCITKAECW